MSGTERIAIERQRQLEVEGWSADHDDAHSEDEMALAAWCYIDAVINAPPFLTRPPSDWPWAAGDWKPSDDPIRNLVKAGALIAAEIDRLERSNG